MELLPLWIVIGVIVLLLIMAIVLYNSLVALSKQVDTAWAGIGVQLKRRNDLFGNLVPAVKGYAHHEKEIIDSFSEARKAIAVAAQSGSIEDADASELSFGKAIQGMRAIAEAYPDLKANQNFMQLQEEIADTEGKIQAARRFYNSGVQQYNTKITIFPNNILASLFKFGPRELWDTADRELLDAGLGNTNTGIAF
jgi:LemA protein